MVQGSNPGSGEICPTHPGQLRGPPIPLYNEYHVSFLEVKQPGCGIKHPPPSSAKAKERAELDSLCGPSWPVIVQTLYLISQAIVGQVTSLHPVPYKIIFCLHVNKGPWFSLTLTLLIWRIWWPNNASKWQLGFNSALKGLIYSNISSAVSLKSPKLSKKYICMSIWFTQFKRWIFFFMLHIIHVRFRSSAAV
jgi:hypothetical protein